MKKRKKTNQNKKPSKQVGGDIYDKAFKAADRIGELTDAFCEKYLNEEYRELCEDIIGALLEIELPLESGKPASWASAIVHALGWVNFLQDPHLSPYMTSPQIAEGFGVSQGTMLTKSKIIRDELDMIQLDPEWCLTSLLKDNPLVWMLKVNGFVMDIRMAPREAQEEAYRLGLIPYIPADEREEALDSDTEANIIKFPSEKDDTFQPKSSQNSKDDEPGLFGDLRQ
jgi:hypothetical protein